MGREGDLPDSPSLLEVTDSSGIALPYFSMCVPVLMASLVYVLVCSCFFDFSSLPFAVKIGLQDYCLNMEWNTSKSWPGRRGESCLGSFPRPCHSVTHRSPPQSWCTTNTVADPIPGLGKGWQGPPPALLQTNLLFTPSFSCVNEAALFAQ